MSLLSQNLLLAYPPTGTGISVLGSLETETIDSSPTLTYVLDGKVEENPSLPSNAALYSSRRLPMGHHSLELLLKQNGTSLTVSGMTISINPTPTPVHNSMLPVILGGITGGLVLVLLLLVGYFLYRRRGRSKNRPSFIHHY